MRLHFAEIYWWGAGQRVFDVSINGKEVLRDFDIYTAAGGKSKALVEEFPAAADGAGVVEVGFTTIVDNAKVSAIEVIGDGSAGSGGSSGSGGGATPIDCTFYIDPASGGDQNPGTREAPWQTIPGTRASDNSSWLRSAWGPFTTSSPIGPGATLCLVGGGVQTLGGMVILGEYQGSGQGSNQTFYSDGTASDPITLAVDPSWGADAPFTVDFAGDVVEQWQSCFQARMSHVALRGASDSRRLRLRASNQHIVQIRGTGSNLSHVLADFLELDGVDARSRGYAINTCLDVSWTDHYAITNTKAHDCNVGFTAGGWADAANSKGIFYGDETYDNRQEGVVVYGNTSNIKVVKLRSHDNWTRGMNTGVIGNTQQETSVLDSEFWGNHENCAKTSCAGSSCTTLWVDSVCYGARDTSPTGGAYCSDGPNHGMPCSGLDDCNVGGVGWCIRDDGVGSYQGASGYWVNMTIANNGQSSWGHGFDQNVPGPLSVHAMNTIFYEKGASCYGDQGGDISTEYNIWTPEDADSERLSSFSDGHSCYSESWSYATPPPWSAVTDLRGLSYKPSFVNFNRSGYPNADLHLAAGSPGIDQGAPYCTVTSPSGTSATFTVTCYQGLPAELFFYDERLYPGGVVPQDDAYIGAGTGQRCLVRSISGNEISCAEPVTFQTGDNVSRKPVMGAAPDIGAYEYGAP